MTLEWINKSNQTKSHSVVWKQRCQHQPEDGSNVTLVCLLPLNLKNNN